MSRYRNSGSFSRNGYGNSKQDEVGRTIFERVDRLLESRWKLLCPFEIVKQPEQDLWRYALTPSQWQAWTTLSSSQHFEKAISRQSYFDIVNKAAEYSIRVFVNNPLPRWPLEWSNLPVDLWEKVHRWQVQSRSYRDEFTTISAKVKALVRLCTTPGQIERVWPQLMGFMPDETKHERFDKKARSPYPFGVLNDNGTLKDEWSAEHLAWYDTAITESLILPLYVHPEGAPNYPEIRDPG